MILPRNRKVGSFSDIDRGRTRFVNFTSDPRHSNPAKPENPWLPIAPAQT
jgi:hypothetical protein